MHYLSMPIQYEGYSMGLRANYPPEGRLSYCYKYMSTLYSLFETFKSIRKQNSNCLNVMFKIKELDYALRKMLMQCNQKGKQLHLV